MSVGRTALHQEDFAVRTLLAMKAISAVPEAAQLPEAHAVGRRIIAMKVISAAEGEPAARTQGTHAVVPRTSVRPRSNAVPDRKAAHPRAQRAAGQSITATKARPVASTLTVTTFARQARNVSIP